MQGTLILGLFFALIIAIFSIQNAVPVSLIFFSWRFEISLVVVVLGAVALGAVMMGLFSSLKQLKLGREIRSLKNENKKLVEAKEELEIEQEQLNSTLVQLENAEQENNEEVDQDQVEIEKKQQQNENEESLELDE